MTHKEYIEATAGKNFVSVMAKSHKAFIYQSSIPVFRDGKWYFHVIFSKDSGVMPGERHQMIPGDEIKLL